MAENARWKGLPWVVATGAVVGLAVLLVVLLKRPEPSGAPEAEPPVAATSASTSPAQAPTPAATPSAPVAAAQPGGGTVSPYLPQPPSGDEAPQIHPVDLQALRAKLPDNLYWTLGAPTEDPEVLKWRDDETRRWNDVYGKVLSGVATEEEVRQYYAHRREVSEDMVAFATTVLADYGDRLPDQERGLYELSIDMNRTRLSELPRQEQEALTRRQEQEQRREAWRQGQQQP
ncbi:hypothetical protein [Pyxidicoccus sp. MSG2]|uniref:hypothetical protein n=1 Tax=Pyxidicoccus sp. MSG2 TaxID=2996790 RepID=UPI00227138ED|nr:hypothetical protein [Pyxidicoccus sp. MSG2]MCY1021065.1 hypothetical protein [Pyxidicoccus sp. MSG2]